MNIGLFAHQALPPEPRPELWQPIDEEYINGGEADSTVPNFDAPPPAAIPRYIAKLGVKRGISSMNHPEEKKGDKRIEGRRSWGFANCATVVCLLESGKRRQKSM